jgi:hypothetical protein
MPSDKDVDNKREEIIHVLADDVKCATCGVWHNINDIAELHIGEVEPVCQSCLDIIIKKLEEDVNSGKIDKMVNNGLYIEVKPVVPAENITINFKVK